MRPSRRASLQAVFSIIATRARANGAKTGIWGVRNAEELKAELFPCGWSHAAYEGGGIYKYK